MPGSGSPEPASAVAALIVELDSDNVTVRQRARLALTAIGATATPALAAALHDGSNRLRWEAAKALADIKDPAAAPALVQALEDREFGVRWLASEALLGLGVLSVEPVLRALMSRPQSFLLRQSARRLLRWLYDQEICREQLEPVLDVLSGAEPEITVPVAAKAALAALAAAGANPECSDPSSLVTA
jgi:HEAT repeat protein